VRLDASNLPGEGNSTIHYTLDGQTPDANSPVYCAGTPLKVDANQTITATLFAGAHALTGPAVLTVHLVHQPEAGCLGTIKFSDWNGQTGPFFSTPDMQAWIGPDGYLADGRNGKGLSAFPELAKGVVDSSGNVLPSFDVNVSRPNPQAALKLHHIHMRENALTVAVWFKTTDPNGPLFGKDGYNAFGKSYKTFACSLNNGRVQASPDHLSGGMVKAGEWNQVILSADINEMSLYLNGKKIASGPGTANLTTDALDLFSSHQVVLDEVTVFNRVLTQDEVSHLYGEEPQLRPF
jgi:hypothetical protein